MMILMSSLHCNHNFYVFLVLTNYRMLSLDIGTQLGWNCLIIVASFDFKPICFIYIVRFDTANTLWMCSFRLVYKKQTLNWECKHWIYIILSIFNIVTFSLATYILLNHRTQQTKYPEYWGQHKHLKVIKDISFVNIFERSKTLSDPMKII